MSGSISAVRSKQKRVLMVAASPAVSTTLGGPVGFWASELIHPWHLFTGVGYAVDIASPKGGKIEPDALSDPRDASGYSAHDLISMGFLHTPKLAALLETTKKLSEVKAADYDAVVVAGGQAPMFTFRENLELQKLLRDFYESEKITAALCHGTAALLDLKLSDGKFLIEGKTMTGFANSEEDFVDKLVGAKVMPYRIEDEARRQGAHYVTAGTWRPFAIQDGHLITGQQQLSGEATARLVIENLGRS